MEEEAAAEASAPRTAPSVSCWNSLLTVLREGGGVVGGQHSLLHNSLTVSTAFVLIIISVFVLFLFFFDIHLH